MVAAFRIDRCWNAICADVFGVVRMRLTVGFSTTNSFISRAIRFFTGGKVSHSYVRFFDEFLRTELVFHADKPVGCAMDDWAVFKQQNVVVNEFEIDDIRTLPAIQANLHKLRKRYDWRRITSWAWFFTFKKWAKRKITSPTKDPKKLICVDFTLHILNRGFTDLPYNHFVPNTLEDWFIENHEALGWKWSHKLES